MTNKEIEERVIVQKLKGSIVEESLELSLKKLRKQIEVARRDGQLILNTSIVSRPGCVGKVIVCVKKIIRKGVWWYINPVCEQQNKFNEEVIAVLNGILSILNQQKEETSSVESAGERG